MKLHFCDRRSFYSENPELTNEEREAAVEFLSAAKEDSTVAFSYAMGCIILRYFDTDSGYFFSAPYALCENADIEKAYAQISEYCRLEEVPETVVDVLEDELQLVLRGATEYSAEKNDEGTYVVSIYTPPMLCEYLPETLESGVYLGDFSDSFADDYEKLLKNVNLNRYFGYNMLDDVPSGRGIDLINFARDEFDLGKSMTFAATVLEDGKNVFIGEGCLYGFNGRGRADVSFRVLPEFHRRGFGKAILKGLVSIASSLPLTELRAEVKRENAASVALMSRMTDDVIETEEKITYNINVEKFKIESVP